MNELELFNQNETAIQVLSNQNVLNHSFSIYGTFENPLFLAKDVAEFIEYDISSLNKMLSSVDEDEKLVGTIFRAGQNREMWFLTENGLYEVLMLSRKPIAKEFKKEVKKILHEIRTKGSFQVPKTFKEALLLAAAQQEKIEQQQKQLIEQQPKVEAWNVCINDENYISFRDCAKTLGVKESLLMTYLRNHNWILQNRKPTFWSNENGFAKEFPVPTLSRTQKYQTKISKNGLEFLANRIEKIKLEKGV